jgi:hypothetical protein
MTDNLANITVMNEYQSIDDLPFTPEQKMMVLAWFAEKLYEIELVALDADGTRKVYDPLSFWDGLAHSYVFDLEDGGRHHEYDSLGHLEAMLINEIVELIRQNADGYR